MNSRDPWSAIVTDPYGDVIAPRPYYGHPFYKEVPSWIHYGQEDGTTRQLFDGVFVGADTSAGAEMTPILGAELTALSAPGAFYGRYSTPNYGGRSFHGGYDGRYGRAFYGQYGDPFYDGYGSPFYGTFGPWIGAEPQAPVPVESRRTGLLAEVAPVMAPATGGITVKKEFDDKQVLHVEICVDGKCYKTSMDLAPAVAMVMAKLATWHQGQHAQQSPPSTVVSTIGNAISAAGDEMANVMVNHHVSVMSGSWISDLGSALGGTLRKLQPAISTVATGVATAFGGPAAGAAVGKLSPMWTNMQANLLDPKGSPKKKAAAQQALQQINQAAASDPATAQALSAIKNTTVAYHVKETAQRAAAGDPKAQADISTLVQAAEQGDPAAKSTFEVLARTFGQELMKSDAGAKLLQQLTGGGMGTPTATAGWYDIVGAAVDDVREKARAHAVTKPGNAAGVLITTEGQLHGRGFRNLDDAIDWLQHITRNRGSFTYAAAYEKAADGSAYIQDEEIGGTSTPLTGM